MYGYGQASTHAPPGWQQAPPPPQPGAVPLRPLTVGDVLGACFSTLRTHGGVLYGNMLRVLGVMALVVLGMAGVLFALAEAEILYDGSTNDDLAIAVAVSLVTSVATAGLFFWGTAAIQARSVVVAHHAVLGQRLPGAEVRRHAGDRVGSLMGNRLLLGFICGSVMGGAYLIALVLVFVAVDNGDSSPALAMLGALLVSCAGVATMYLVVRFTVSAASCVLEGQGPAQSLSRSGHLVTGNWWRVLGITFLVNLLVNLFTQLTSWLLALLVMLTVDLGEVYGDTDDVGQIILVSVILGFAVLVPMALALPFRHLAMTFIYTDLRVRHERYDLELATQTSHSGPAGPGPFAAPGGYAPPPQPAGYPPPPQGGPMAYGYPGPPPGPPAGPPPGPPLGPPPGPPPGPPAGY